MNAAHKPLDIDQEELIEAKAILAECPKLNPEDLQYSAHELIQRFGSPQKPIHIDQGIVNINSTQFENPVLLPIVDGQLKLIQCAVMQNNRAVSVIPDGLAKGFACYGDFYHDQPIIITYSLEAFFKIAQTDYAVALVILPTLCSTKPNPLKGFDFKQIEFVIKQLSQAGYKQLYMPVRAEHIQLEAFQQLEKNTAVRLLNQTIQYEQNSLHIDLKSDDSIEEVVGFICETIELLPERIQASETERMDSLDAEVIRLASLPELQYEQIRLAEAEALGIRTSILDKLIKTKRKEIADNKSKDDFFEYIEPWHMPINGHELLNSIEQIINHHITCEPHTRIAIVLWIVYTWAIEAMEIAPIACITAPEKRCGKTQLLTLISALCYKPLSTSNITAPALYRSIEEWKPTLLIDEADTFFKDNEDLRGVINAGHNRKNAYVIRCQGDDNKPTRFNVWCAKAISGIGHLPETIKDRSIILELRRKLPSEHKQRLRYADQGQWHNIKRQCLRWVNDNFETIKNTHPELPEQLNDRAQDNWECLFIIAQIASKEWLDKANYAALTINGVEQDTLSVNEQLFTDIKQIFKDLGSNKIFSCGLVKALTKDEENAWATWNRGRPITQNQLASRLKHFGIRSKNIRIYTEVKKGYDLNQFQDAFTRYLPKVLNSSATPLQLNSSKDYSNFKSATTHDSVAHENPLERPLPEACDAVAFVHPYAHHNAYEQEQLKTKCSRHENPVRIQINDEHRGIL